MISIIGATGYVGSYFQKHLKQLDVPFVTCTARFPLDEREFIKHLLQNKITKVINCAGYTGKPNVDSCEIGDNKTDCLFANALLPAAIADVCNKFNIEMFHISSGCIYNDTECEKEHKPSRIFTERDEPNFTYESGYCSWYSGSKALGETLLKGKDVSIFRLRIPFDGSISDRNYIQKIVKYPKLLAATNSFSHLEEYVMAVTQFILTKKRWSDVIFRDEIFNVTQPGYLTTHEVVDILRKYNLVKDKTWFNSVEHFSDTNLAPRSNCVLDSTKAINRGFKLTHVQDAMEDAISKYAYNLKHA